MRKIKFRAWDDGKKEWLLGYNYPNLGGFSLDGECVLMGEWAGICTSFMFENNGKKRTDLKVMQFTGLKDKNGKEIFEDDICLLEINGFNLKPSFIPFLIVFNVDGFQGSNILKKKKDFLNNNYLFSPRRFNYAEWKKLEVVGNIYENPELL